MEDLKAHEQKWTDEIDTIANLEGGLQEAIGANEITLGLDDFVRILINYRQISKPRYHGVKAAFEALGAKGGMIDRLSFLTALYNHGEVISPQEWLESLQYLVENQQQLSDHVTAEEFAKRYLQLDISDAEGEDEENFDQIDEDADEELQQAVKIADEPKEPAANDDDLGNDPQAQEAQ